jgi:UDP-glucuronate 4-epimerase
MNYLVTGAAGFIGSHVVRRICDQGNHVLGIDNLNDYYDINLKKSRIKELSDLDNFEFKKIDISHNKKMISLFRDFKFDRVIHLAAQAGVRYSLINPYSYIESNLSGFISILEGCRSANIEHLVYASSSSVYGLNNKMPFSTSDSVDHPLSLYGATKKSNELMAHSYSYLYGIPTTGLRFFTVYGPRGRPDMALFLFTKAILEGRPIDVYNKGEMFRDFTYIDDIVEGIIRIQNNIPKENPAWNQTTDCLSESQAPYKIYNIGNGNPVNLNDFIKQIEEYLGVEAKKNFLPIQPGDVLSTHSEIDDLFKDIGYKPITNVREGIKRFLDWYIKYYKIKKII